MLSLSDYFRNIPKLLFGLGTLRQLQSEIIALSSHRVLLIAEPTIEHRRIVQSFKKNIAPYVHQVQIYYVTNVENKWKATTDYPATIMKGDYDTIIGLGCNDLLNYSKVIAHRLHELNSAPKEKKELRHENPIHVLLLPTTPTSGMELSPTIYKYRYRMKVMTNKHCPTLQTVLYDPLLSLHCSPYEMISSTVLTLSEAIEAQFSPSEGNSFALSAIKLINDHVIRAIYHPNDVEAIEALVKAGMLLGLANVPRYEHSLIDSFIMPIMKKVDISYSYALATMLPYMIYFYRQMNETNGLFIIESLNVSGEKVDDAYHYFIARLANLMKTLGFPLHLQALGIKEGYIEDLSSMAYTLSSTYRIQDVSFPKSLYRLVYEKAFIGIMD